MPEINWDITPGWGGTGRLSKFAGRRKTKEWNLLGNLFTAQTAERYNLVNRVCEPDALDDEVGELIEILLSRHPQTLTVTKYFVDKAADLDMWQSLVFEGVPQRPTGIEGIKSFSDVQTRNERRKRSMDFWQD
jgi:enoyl-CoA hydratase